VSLKRSSKSQFPFIDLQFIVMKGNEEEIGQMKKLAEEMGVDKLSFYKLDANYINFNKFENFTSREDLLPRNKEFSFENDWSGRDNFCNVPWEETLICYSGLVLPCTPDHNQENKMGKLFENGRYMGFKRLWNSNAYCSLRRKVKEDIDGINSCRICTKRNNTVKQNISLK